MNNHVSYPIAKIDLAALKHNFSIVKQLAVNSQIMSVIKADAYGHGAVEIAQALTESDGFAVARLTEALSLRQAGIKQPIIILEGVQTAKDLELACEHSLSLVFHHQYQIDLLKSTPLNNALAFAWLMLETGMHRLGLTVDESQQALPFFDHGMVGIMSHFANADELDDSRNSQQLAKIQSFAHQHQLDISMANSAAISSCSDSHHQWVRPGLMLYGISPFIDKTSAQLGLKPVMQLCAQLIAIKSLQQGDQVGYGGEWQAEKAMTIGIVNIGYGDGYKRILSNKSRVSINGHSAQLIGRVSMDMIAIELAGSDDHLIGDEVILWGDDNVSVEDLALQANTIAYELVCQVSKRVTRSYYYGES